MPNTYTRLMLEPYCDNFSKPFKLLNLTTIFLLTLLLFECGEVWAMPCMTMLLKIYLHLYDGIYMSMVYLNQSGFASFQPSSNCF